MSKPHVKEMWSGSQLKVFFPFLLWDGEVLFFFLQEVKAYTLSAMGQDSQKAPALITSDIQPPPPFCPLKPPQDFRDYSCLGHHLQGELWDWNQGVWQDTSSHSAFRHVFGGWRRPANTGANTPLSLLTLHNWSSVEKPPPDHGEKAQQRYIFDLHHTCQGARVPKNLFRC